MMIGKGEASASPGAALATGGAAPGQWALARIVATSDIIQLPDGSEYLLTPATPELVDCLAVYGAEAEDMEDEGVALDWTFDYRDQVNGRPRYRVMVQDGEAEQQQADGGAVWPHP